MKENLVVIRRQIVRRLPPRLAAVLRRLLRRSPAAARRTTKGPPTRVRSVQESRINRNGLAAGTPAPLFTLLDLDGNERSLEDFRGRRVLLVFTDPTCKPCESIAPAIVAVHDAHGSNGLEVVAVSRGDVEANRTKVEEYGFSFPVLLQKGWRVSKQFGIFATPVAYLLDEHGVIVENVAVGIPDVADLCHRLSRHAA
jgi:peroxiredoxin